MGHIICHTELHKHTSLQVEVKGHRKLHVSRMFKFAPQAAGSEVSLGILVKGLYALVTSRPV